VIVLDETRYKTQKLADPADEEKVIPWAEGNGLWDTVASLASDLIGADVATFFVQNPYACDSAESLGVRIGRTVTQIGPVLDRYAEAALLQKVDLGEVCVYMLTDDMYHRQTLQQYVSWLQEGYHWARMVMDRD
jgi:hypothetical protein